MSLLRSARFPAIVLLAAAALALLIANSPLGPSVETFMSAPLGIPGVIQLSIDHWIADGLLAVFFFVVAVELRYELTAGELNSVRRAVHPAIAAAGGVALPIVVFLAVVALATGGEGSPAGRGWPIPTATDIAFALGVLAVFGKGLPSGLRIFLLALAILDDVVGIVFIAVLFTDDVDVVLLGTAVVLLAAFALLSRRLGRGLPGDASVAVALVLLAVLTWAAVYLSGVHATIAGVGLGLAMAQAPALRVRHAVEPWVNAVILPLFAFAAALVVIPAVSPAELSPVFWGVVVALPVGKIVGVTLFAALAQRLFPHSGGRLPWADLLAAGALGGIGFTVSLLLSELAFAADPVLRDQATLGVLAGSLISLVLAAGLVSWRAWHYRRMTPATVTT